MSITLPLPLLKKYFRSYFVETGSFRGDGIAKALMAGFPNVYSIESNDYYFKVCNQRFGFDSRVQLFLGSSSKELGRAICNITSEICFWLDAHSPTESPILEELSQIKSHPIKTHVIMIDDIRLFGDINGFKDISIEQIRDALLEINPNYTIEFVDSLQGNERILIAHV